MLPRNHPDRIQITFDDRRLVANAGLLLPATLARHLGLPELVRQRLDLGDAPGRANTSDKMMTLVASALAGGDCIDDADVLRTGGTACTLGGTVKAPSNGTQAISPVAPSPPLPLSSRRPSVSFGGFGVKRKDVKRKEDRAIVLRFTLYVLLHLTGAAQRRGCWHLFRRPPLPFRPAYPVKS